MTAEPVASRLAEVTWVGPVWLGRVFELGKPAEGLPLEAGCAAAEWICSWVTKGVGAVTANPAMPCSEPRPLAKPAARGGPADRGDAAASGGEVPLIPWAIIARAIMSVESCRVAAPSIGASSLPAKSPATSSGPISSEASCRALSVSIQASSACLTVWALA